MHGVISDPQVRNFPEHTAKKHLKAGNGIAARVLSGVYAAIRISPPAPVL